MAFDFTLEKYGELCVALLENGYSPMTVSKYIAEQPFDGRICILRHDVDRKPGNALRMAELERRLGISSTYYFRYPYTFRPEVVRRIAGMGHEVGYHYETLAKADGDHERAIWFFEQELEAMRKIADIRTICMHGSPLSRYDNRDLWKNEDFRRFGIAGEAYLSIRKVSYFSDTGRSWNSRSNLRDFLCDNDNGSISVRTTDEMIDLVEKRHREALYLVTHPERWASGFSDWGQSFLRDIVFNAGKIALKTARRLGWRSHRLSGKKTGERL